MRDYSEIKIILLLFILCIFVMPFLAQDFNLVWNTFLGSSGDSEDGYGIAMDNSGNSYVIGSSRNTWGSPILPHHGGFEAFVACLDNTGNLVWNTFLGSSSTEYGSDIVLDSSGNIYVTGYSGGTWGSPVQAHSGRYDAFAACLDSNGNLVWNTFLGSNHPGSDFGQDITLDNDGNVYVIGNSPATWGTPVNAFSGGNSDVFVASLDNTGNLVWNTFMGSGGAEYGYGIVADNTGNIYVTGNSGSTCGAHRLMPLTAVMTYLPPVSTVMVTLFGILFWVLLIVMRAPLLQPMVPEISI